jgi:2-C-methyl-D-erythritol 4-phosphate cytidylyltransferase
MKTHALIFAGGTGQRMNTRATPKQFLELHGKPVIIYTLEHFEYHPEVDNIVVVCLESWIRNLKHLIQQYGIAKISQIIPGNPDGGDKSIYNGLKAMEGKVAPDDTVLIHDGVRPLINSELISANIAKVKEKGNAVTVEAVTESVVQCNSTGNIINVPPRVEMFSAKAPQSFRYGQIWDLYQKSAADDVRTIDSVHLCNLYGVEMHTVKSTPNNMKITAPTDYYIFRALFEAMENEQILGV